jgi:hypothetical protein
VLATLLILLPALAFGQSNDELDALLLQAPARIDSTAYLILAASGAIAETDSPDSALARFVEMGLVPAGTDAGAPVQAEKLSWFIMKALDLGGGAMYTIFPGPRYAYREMAFRRVISQTGGPLRTVNGDEVVRTVTQAMALKKGASQ